MVVTLHDVVTTVFTVCFSCCEKVVDSLIQNTLLQGDTCSLVATPYNHTYFKLIQAGTALEPPFTLLLSHIQCCTTLLPPARPHYRPIQACTTLFGV